LTENILVTGGAGFIGSHLVDALLSKGHRVRVLDNLEPQVHKYLGELGEWPGYCNREAEYILGDIRDPQVVSKAIEGIDVIFHEAALVGVGQSMYEISRYTDVNTQGTSILLQGVIGAKCPPRKIIVASSMSIYGEGAYLCPRHGRVYPKLRKNHQLLARDWEMYCPVPLCKDHISGCPTDEDKPLHPTSIYAINKRDQEEMVLTVGQAYGIPAVALRYFNIYGTRQALSNPYTGVAAIFSGRLLNDKPPVIYEDGRQSRDFTHVSDIVQANLLVLDCDQANWGVYNVGTGRALTILDMAMALTNQLGINVQQEIVGNYRAGDIRHCFADIRNLQALGYQPGVKFEEGIAELVEWVRSQTAEDNFERARIELINRGLAR